ncbi:uncharacterized protein F4822DRAFT_114443 [Hypoxylon trugodes]|uniref:uncharacterized protein n=1 Tax=Hypoxylon trugodes TaxID=326681 RepID=UPI00218EC4D8|nr:uncharacterized protein F4822DRAFT_114443 [Hypoxylon trugodes]KAI1392047.1 hypothetical protein F4822DRAFT_114443 [Hypoxylon trugodes]
MQFTSFFAAAAALAMGANAAAVAPRDGARLAQFRVYGADGCGDLNQGFFTVDESDANTCKTFINVPTPPGVVSLNLESMNFPAANGCSFFIYTDTNCGAGRRALSVDVCNDVVSPATSWGSWQIFCPSLNA